MPTIFEIQRCDIGYWSRQIDGIRGKSLILNLPGKASAIDDCLNAVFPAIPCCIDLIAGAYLEFDTAVQGVPFCARETKS